MPVIVQLTAVGHHVVVLHAEGRPALRSGLALDINGALPISTAGILPVFRSMSTLNNSVLGQNVFKIILLTFSS